MSPLHVFCTATIFNKKQPCLHCSYFSSNPNTKVSQIIPLLLMQTTVKSKCMQFIDTVNTRMQQNEQKYGTFQSECHHAVEVQAGTCMQTKFTQPSMHVIGHRHCHLMNYLINGTSSKISSQKAQMDML